jgi:hypothetical protein
MLLGLIAALMIACIAIAIVLRGGSQTQTNLYRQKWLARPFANYEMDISVDALAQCQTRYTVIDEQVTDVVSTGQGCNELVYSVSDLFAEIEKDRGCGPNGCGCDGPIGAEAEYDETLGYPTRIEIRLMPERRLSFPDYWAKKLPFYSYCTDAGFIGTIIEVNSLTPIP